MDEVFKSISKWFSEKTSSPLYFTYVCFFIAWNWKFFQVIFLENERLFNTPRIEYIKSNLYLVLQMPEKTPHLLSTVINWVMNLGWHIIPPAILTIIAIILFPYAQRWALEYSLDSRFERKRMFETKLHEYEKWLLGREKERAKTLENLVSLKEEQSRAEEKIDKTLSQDEKWEIEYEKFKDNTSFYKFKQVIETIYKHSGYVESNNERNIDAGTLAIADTWGLITFPYQNDNVIELTAKGKVFARMYLNKHSIL